jgi:hypothetical protein
LVGTILLVFPGLDGASAQSSCGVVYPSPTALPDPEPSPQPAASAGAAASPDGDPCLQGSTVFGPTRFEKTRILPRVETSGFSLESAGDVCILSESSGYGSPVKAWPVLGLDGSVIATPPDYIDLYDQQIHKLEAGAHDISVVLFGRRGAWMDVEARQIVPGDGGGGDDDFPGLPAPGEVQIDPATGAIDMVSVDGKVRLQNLATDHPYLTPDGDGDNDVTEFRALVTPLVALPGKDDGSVNYFVAWEFQIRDLETCGTINAGLSGTTQINSPTLVSVTWDGTDEFGNALPNSNYGYVFHATIVDQFGVDFGTLTSPVFGIVLDVPQSAVDYDEALLPVGADPFCDQATDPDSCRCRDLDDDGEPDADDANCKFAITSELLPELGSPPGVLGNYNDPSLIDRSFITTTVDPVTGRHEVFVDLRDYNAGGLVPKGAGQWTSEAELRQWVASMTEVPAGTGDSLFNFDYVQVDTTTGVDGSGIAFNTLNHFLLDAMTDTAGQLRYQFLVLGGTPPSGGGLLPNCTGGLPPDNPPCLFTKVIPLGSSFNDDADAPLKFQVSDTARRTGDECTNSGNSDGVHVLHGKFCAYNTAVSVDLESDDPLNELGIYMLRTTTFDIRYDVPTVQDGFCTFDSTGLTCGIRTRQVRADTLEIESSYYVDNAGDPALTRTRTDQANDAVSLSVAVDRGDGEDGVCSRAALVKGGLAVRMDAADGAVPDTCIINGIF